MDQFAGSMAVEITKRCRQFVSAWCGWRGGAPLPRRSDVRIDDIVELLPAVTVMEAFSPAEIHVRLAGTLIDDFSGDRLTGINVLDLTAPEIRDLRAQRMWNMAVTPCGSLLHFVHRYPDSGARLPMEVISLPVASDKEDGPVQLFTLFSSDRPEREVVPPSNRLQHHLPDDFVFLDIGCGGPDDGSGETIPLLGLLAD